MKIELKKGNRKEKIGGEGEAVTIMEGRRRSWNGTRKGIRDFGVELGFGFSQCVRRVGEIANCGFWFFESLEWDPTPFREREREREAKTTNWQLVYFRQHRIAVDSLVLRFTTLHLLLKK